MPMNARLLRPLASGAFNPKQISGLEVWLDASDASTLTIDTGVSEWRDKSGKGANLAQATGLDQPAYDATGINGRPAVEFDGVNHFMAGTMAANGTKPWTLFFVGNAIGPNSGQFWLFIGASGSGTQMAFTAERGFRMGAGNRLWANNTLDATTVATFANVGNENSNLEAWDNGSLLTPTSTTSPLFVVDIASTAFSLGASPSGSSAEECACGELMFFSRYLTESERQKIEGYLAWKWGLQGQLPYDHPYAKSFPGFGSQATPTDADTLTYLAAVKAADGTGVEVGVANAVDAFVTGCKSDGIWDAIKASCILAGARTLAGALVPLKGAAPTNNNFTASDYNRETGLVGDGSTTSLNTNRDNNADPQDDNHNALYITAANANDPAVYIGSDTSATAGYNQMTISSSAGVGALVTSARNAAAAFDVLAGGGDETGFHGSSRSSSSEYVVRVLGANTTHSRASVAPTSSDVHVFARGPTPAVFTDARIAFYSIGEALDLEALDTRVTALITAIGAAI